MYVCVCVRWLWREASQSTNVTQSILMEKIEKKRFSFAWASFMSTQTFSIVSAEVNEKTIKKFDSHHRSFDFSLFSIFFHNCCFFFILFFCFPRKFFASFLQNSHTLSSVLLHFALFFLLASHSLSEPHLLHSFFLCHFALSFTFCLVSILPCYWFMLTWCVAADDDNKHTKKTRVFSINGIDLLIWMCFVTSFYSMAYRNGIFLVVCNKRFALNRHMCRASIP